MRASLWNNWNARMWIMSRAYRRAWRSSRDSLQGGGKSTVATLTEVYHFLRLLFAKLGTQYCPRCAIPVTKQSVAAIFRQVRDIVTEDACDADGAACESAERVSQRSCGLGQARGIPRIDR